MDESDRPRGILSPADRKFLLGEADLESEQSRYDARYRIRRRVRNALLDFTLLLEHLEARDRDQVFDPPADRREAVTDGVVDALAFLYLGMAAYDVPRREFFREAIRRAERRRGEDGSLVTVRFDVQHPSRDRLEWILRRVEAGAFHELAESDLRALACLLHETGHRSPRALLEELGDDAGE